MPKIVCRKVITELFHFSEKKEELSELAKINSDDSNEEEKTTVVGLIQTFCVDDIERNVKKTMEKTEQAALKGAQIICLQELYRTLYFPQEKKCNARKFAETIPGPSTKIFSTIAKKHKVVIIVPIYEKHPNGKYYNSAVTIDADGKILGTYRKIHIPNDPLFYENNYFEPGFGGYKVYKTKYAKIGVLICYDQWFPEAARITAMKGADIIFYPTAIGTVKNYRSADGDWHEAWKTIQRAHAIANGVHVAAVNRVGEESQLRFWGKSFACDSFGNVIKEASGEKEEVLIAKLDLSKNQRIQEGWGFLRNRRPDTYHALTKRLDGEKQ